MVIIRSVAIIAIAAIAIGWPHIGTTASSHIGVSVVDGNIPASINIDVVVAHPVVTATVHVSRSFTAVCISGGCTSVCSSIGRSVGSRGTSIGTPVFHG